MKATLSEWKEFLDSSIYADMQEDIKERKEILTVKLIAGKDSDFTDDNMRGRISELDFISSMVKDIISLIEMGDNKAYTEKVLHKLKGNP